MAGVNEAVVQKLAGHGSIDTTLKYYTHIFSDVLRKAPTALPFARIVGLSREDGIRVG